MTQLTKEMGAHTEVARRLLIDGVEGLLDGALVVTHYGDGSMLRHAQIGKQVS